MGDSTQNTWEKYPAALPEDSILAGQYIIQDVLGQGGFGITYLAEDCQLKAKVAIKEFFPESIIMRQSGVPHVTVYSGGKLENFNYGLRCFLDEARVLAQFQGNPNIVGVRSYFEENNTAYFVMDYIEGVDLKTYIQRHGGKLGWVKTWDIMRQVMDALIEVHRRGIIHRDVTPDNILITGDRTVKLLDFGAARYSFGDRSQSLDVVLKAGYAPKEQYTRRGKQGPYTDVYSVAACFYTALCGYLPPESLDRMDKDELVPLSARGVQLPKNAEKAIMKGLEVQSEKRFQSMDEFRSAIIEGKTDDTGKWKQFLKKYRAVLAGVAAVIAVIAVVASFRGDKPEPKDGGGAAAEEMGENTARNNREEGAVPDLNLAEAEEFVPEQEKNTAEQDREEEKQCVDFWQARLDALCRNELENYVDQGFGTVKGVSDEREGVIEDWMNSLLASYAGDDFSEYTSLIKECFLNMLSKAQYMVKSAEKQEDGSYLVAVTYTQMQFFDSWKEIYDRTITGMVSAWEDDRETIIDSEELENALLLFMGLSMEEALEDVKYAQLDEKLVRVKKSGDIFVIEDDEIGDMEELLADFFDFRNSDNVGAFVYDDMSFIGIWEIWEDERVDGNGLGVWSDGDKYLGRTVDGWPHGDGFYSWADDGGWYLGEFKDGQMSGYGIRVYEDGDQYEGEWKDSQRNGYGTYTFADGREDEGNWEDNEFIG